MLNIQFTEDEVHRIFPEHKENIENGNTFETRYSPSVGCWWFKRGINEWSCAHDHSNFISWLRLREFSVNADLHEPMIWLEVRYYQDGEPRSFTIAPPVYTLTTNSRSATLENKGFSDVMDNLLVSRDGWLYVLQGNKTIGRFEKKDGLWYNYCGGEDATESN